jgi:hypothetical protein
MQVKSLEAKLAASQQEVLDLKAALAEAEALNERIKKEMQRQIAGQCCDCFISAGPSARSYKLLFTDARTGYLGRMLEADPGAHAAHGRTRGAARVDSGTCRCTRRRIHPYIHTNTD